MYKRVEKRRGERVSTLDSIYMNSVSSAIAAGQLQQQVYANNIANANTPGYKEQGVQFTSLLQNALAAQGALPQGQGASALPMAANSTSDLSGASSASTYVSPVVTTDESTSTSGNGNNVNLNAQMSALAENQISYSALIQDLNDQFSMMQTAITG